MKKLKKPDSFYRILINVAIKQKTFLSRFFTCVFLLFAFSLHSFDVSKDVYESIVKKVPKWVYHQIEIDLNDCKLEKNVEEVYDYLQSNDYDEKLVLFKIFNNKLSYKGSLERFKSGWVKRFFDFFKKATQYVEFPNVEFIVYSFDRMEQYLINSRLDIEQLHVPIFTISKKRDTLTGILIPHVRHLNQRERFLAALDIDSKTFLWDVKINRFFWRGTATGFGYEDGSNDRLRLVQKSLSNPALIDAAFVHLRTHTEFSHLKLAPTVARSKQIMYKYLVSVQGNSFPSSQHWQLYSNSLTLIVDNPYLEWYYLGIKPYVHYIPLKNDYSDLNEKLTWLRMNDSMARGISKKATTFVKNQLSNERIIHYFYLLLNSYKEKFQGLVEAIDEKSNTFTNPS